MELAKKTQTINSLLANEGIKSRIEQILDKRASAFCSSVISLVKNNEKLSKCDPGTVLSAAMTAATLDLSIDPSLGFAHIVPYKDQASFQMGYKGLIQLALRSGQFVKINDVVLPCGTVTKYDPITETLEYDFSLAKEGNPDGYACYIKLINGFEKLVYWPYEKAYKHGKRFSVAFSKGWSTPWNTDFDLMSLKSVIKATLSKYAPLSVEMQTAITRDQSVEIDGKITHPDNPQSLGIENEKPVLSNGHPAWNKVVERIRLGSTWDEMEDIYSISDDVKQLIETQASQKDE